MGRYKTAKELAFLRRHLSGSQLSVLDIGGGSGRFALPLAGDGHRVTVVDISREALDQLAHHGHPNVRTMHGDFGSANLETKFDAAVAMESLYYFTDHSFRDLFSRVRDHLKPGALFAFMQINSQSWRYQLHKLRGTNRFPYKVTGPDTYVSELRNAGFSVIGIEGFVWMPFGATSNSRAVPVFAALERALGLGRWITQSPWLLIAARRVD